MDQFGEDSVRRVAELARLKLSDGEVKNFARQVGQILGYIEKLNRLDTSLVEPLTRAFELATPMRADEVVVSPGSEAMLAVAPEQLYDSYKVPQVIGGGS